MHKRTGTDNGWLGVLLGTILFTLMGAAVLVQLISA